MSILMAVVGSFGSAAADVTPTLSAAWPNLSDTDSVTGVPQAVGAARTISDINQTITLKLSAPSNPNANWIEILIKVSVNGGAASTLCTWNGSSWSYTNNREFSVSNNQTVSFEISGSTGATAPTTGTWTSESQSVTNSSDGNAAVGSTFSFSLTGTNQI